MWLNKLPYILKLPQTSRKTRIHYNISNKHANWHYECVFWNKNKTSFHSPGFSFTTTTWKCQLLGETAPPLRGHRIDSLYGSCVLGQDTTFLLLRSLTLINVWFYKPRWLRFTHGLFIAWKLNHLLSRMRRYINFMDKAWCNDFISSGYCDHNKLKSYRLSAIKGSVTFNMNFYYIWPQQSRY